MLLDLGRNDVGRVARVGTVHCLCFQPWARFKY